MQPLKLKQLLEIDAWHYTYKRNAVYRISSRFSIGFKKYVSVHLGPSVNVH
jgi:hypothetical protein